MIFVRNVIFDEQQMWDEKTIEYIIKNVKQFDETISIIEIPHIDEIEDQQFGEDDLKDIADNLIRNPASLAETDEADVAVEEAADEVADEKNKQTKQNKLNWMANQYFSSDSFIVESMLVQFIFIAFNAASHCEEMTIETEEIKSMKNVFIKSAILDEFKKRQSNRFYNFKSQWILIKMSKAFTANFKHTFLFKSKHYKDLKGHPYEKDFRDFMEQQIKQHKQDFNSWTAVDRRKFSEHQILRCQWVFKYKTGKHGELLKCKTRIVVCGNQQHWSELFIQMITLVIAFFFESLLVWSLRLWREYIYFQ